MKDNECLTSQGREMNRRRRNGWNRRWMLTAKRADETLVINGKTVINQNSALH